MIHRPLEVPKPIGVFPLQKRECKESLDPQRVEGDAQQWGRPNP